MKEEEEEHKKKQEEEACNKLKEEEKLREAAEYVDNNNNNNTANEQKEIEKLAGTEKGKESSVSQEVTLTKSARLRYSNFLHLASHTLME